MDILETIITVLAILFLCICIVKTIHFLMYSSRKKIKYWFYFNAASIVNSQSLESEKAKKIQNMLSVALLTVGIISFVVLLLLYKVTKS